MGSAGDPPAPVGDPPTGTLRAVFGKIVRISSKRLLSFRPASRRTGQAGRLCYPKRFFTQALQRRKDLALVLRAVVPPLHAAGLSQRDNRYLIRGCKKLGWA